MNLFRTALEPRGKHHDRGMAEVDVVDALERMVNEAKEGEKARQEMAMVKAANECAQMAAKRKRKVKA